MAAEDLLTEIRLPEADFDRDGHDPFAEFAASIGAGARRNPYAEFARRRRQGQIHKLTMAESLAGQFRPDQIPTDEEALRQIKYMWSMDQGELLGAYGYQAASEILRDPERFNSSGYVRNIGMLYDHGILEMDGAEHLRHRELVNEAFHPRNLERWEVEHFRPVIEQTIDSFAAKGRAELVTEFNVIYPVKIIAGILGVPLEHWQWYQRRSIELINFSHLDRALKVCAMLKEYFRQIIAFRHRHPAGDLISELVRAEIGGEQLSDEEILPFLLILTPAGAETTSLSTGNALYALLRHPEQFEAVRADRSLIRQTIEEVLRWEPPLLEINRWATCDTEVRGMKIPAGSRINVSLGSANHDTAFFGDDAEEFNIFRERKQHLAFALGRHLCLGIHLARIEMRLAIGALLDRLPNLRLDPARVAESYIDGVLFRSPNQLPVLFDCGRT